MRRLFVANAGDDSISVLCPLRMRETERIPLGKGSVLGPRCIAVRNGRLIIANSFDSSVASLDLSTGELEFCPVGACPGSMCQTLDGWIVACAEANSLWKLSFELEPLYMADLGKFPFSLSCCGSMALAVNLGSHEAVLFDTSTLLQTIRVKLPGNPFGSLLLEDKLLVSQSLNGEGVVSVYGYDGAFVGNIPLGGIPGRLLPLGNKLLAANYWGRGLFVLNLGTFKMDDRWDTSGMPDEMALDLENERLFVSCMLDNAVDVLTFAGERVGSIKVGKEPRGLAIEEA